MNPLPAHVHSSPLSATAHKAAKQPLEAPEDELKWRLPLPLPLVASNGAASYLPAPSGAAGPGRRCPGNRERRRRRLPARPGRVQRVADGEEITLGIMSIKDFVVLPGSKAGTSVRLKAKNVRELQLEKVQLELENKEMEKKLEQLQSNMNKEKEERKKSRAFHWRSGQAGPMTTHAHVLSQKQENSNKVSSGKVKLKMLKEQIQGKDIMLSKRKLPSNKPSESIRTDLEKQETGLLLRGTFNEEESTRSFQEALMQWRNRYCDHRTGLNSSEVLSEPVRVCEVQTHLTLMKEPIQVEFKVDSLSYLEKLLLKKHRRTPINQVSSNQVNDLRTGQTINEHQAAVIGEGAGKGGGGGGDDDYSTVFLLPSESGVATSHQRSTVPDLLPTEIVGVTSKSFGHLNSTADPPCLLPLLSRNPFFPKGIPQGDGKWAIDRGLTEYADDSVVEDVLANQLNRFSNLLERQNPSNRMSSLMVACPGNDSRRPWSTNMLFYKWTGKCPTSTWPRPRSSPIYPTSGVNESSRDKCLMDEQEEDVLGDDTDQETLLSLERELQSYTRNTQERICSLTSKDIRSTNFHQKMELEDHSRVDSSRGWDEGQMDDEEEVLEDKRQVFALQ
ncbi:zinc finger B-box domain-containing protein 1 [Eudromia elegans]